MIALSIYKILERRPECIIRYCWIRDDQVIKVRIHQPLTQSKKSYPISDNLIISTPSIVYLHPNTGTVNCCFYVGSNLLLSPVPKRCITRQNPLAFKSVLSYCCGSTLIEPGTKRNARPPMNPAPNICNKVIQIMFAIILQKYSSFALLISICAPERPMVLAARLHGYPLNCRVDIRF